MDNRIVDLIGTWKVESPLLYIFVAAMLSLGVRIIASLLKACEREAGSSYWHSFRMTMSGFATDPNMKDYLFTFYLGWIEIAAYPILMRTGNWVIIGAWLTLKVLPQWKHWTEHRPAFNRFLIGNALVLFASLWLAACFVKKVCI